MILQSQENSLQLKQYDQNNKTEEVENNNEVVNDIRDDKDNRKKDMENHISEHDVVLDMGRGNDALSLFNETTQNTLNTEFFIIDETKEFSYPTTTQTTIEPNNETFVNVELFDVLTNESDHIDFEFIEIFTQGNNNSMITNTEELGLSLKSYHACDYSNQETIVYKQENDAIYKENLEVIIEL